MRVPEGKPPLPHFATEKYKPRLNLVGYVTELGVTIGDLRNILPWSEFRQGRSGARNSVGDGERRHQQRRSGDSQSEERDSDALSFVN